MDVSLIVSDFNLRGSTRSAAEFLKKNLKMRRPRTFIGLHVGGPECEVVAE